MSTLHINLSAIQDNLTDIIRIAQENSLELVPVIKSFSGMSEILKLLDVPKIKALGLSRLSASNKLDAFTNNPSLVCISLMSRSELTESFFQFDEVYLSSEIALQRYINLAVENPQKKLKLTFLVDCGDHREGLSFDKVYHLIKKYYEKIPSNLKIAGLATTLGCNFGVLPSIENLSILNTLSIRLGDLLGYKLETISVGGSIILKMILDKKLPSFITQIRIGEALLLGTIPAYVLDHPQLRQDAFTFKCKIVELDIKPNFSTLSKGLDASGKQYLVSEEKTILQGILNFGILDTDVRGLIPQNIKLTFCNQNSDYTMVEINDDPKDIPQELCFKLNYVSLAQALNSNFVKKKIV